MTDEDRDALPEDAWRSLCDVLRDAERILDASHWPASPLLRAEGLRYLTRYLAGGARLCMELADPDYPELGRMVDTTLSWGIDNPDCLYLYAAVRGDAQYTISGNRGTAHHFDVQVQRGHFAEAPEFAVVSSVGGDEIEVADDGAVEISLGATDGRSNNLALDDSAAWLLVRQYFNDWESERPADLHIERRGAKYPPPPLSPRRVARRLERLRDWFQKGAAYWAEMVRFSLDLGPNAIVFRLPAETAWGGLRGLAYGFGNFRCAPDEAVILEVEPPRCHYWSFSLANIYWETLDWSRRQVSLNGHQAVLDTDGVFRAVISQQDPGVANWLDTGGHEVGTMMGRYLLTDAAPQPRMRKVALGAVAGELPADTPRVTPQARSAALSRRRRAVSSRNRN